jgi:hypothetical protein
MNEHQAEIASALPENLDNLPRLKGFRLRGVQMTRLETFIDAAFAFAISMLVIAAQQIPDDIASLLAAFKNVPTFICSIAVLGIYWRGHWLWSRRYGLEDGASILISWAMIVTILIFIYPLKAIFGAMWYLLSNGQVGQPFSLHTTEAQVRTIFAIYALGVNCHFRRNSAPESSGLAIARAIAVECAGTIDDARRAHRLEHPDKRGDRVAGVFSYFADRKNRVVRLGLFFDGDPGAAARVPAPPPPQSGR